MHLMIEKGIRGGVSVISKRYAKANNPDLEDFDPEKELSYLLYIDANVNLIFSYWLKIETC